MSAADIACSDGFEIVFTRSRRYSSLQVMGNGSIGLLYERSNLTTVVFTPTQILFVALPP